MVTSGGFGVNDFAFKVATVNGTGSASANGLLLQALFRMGVPVSGKNVFPSNIQGLPTWYEIRVNKDGYTARSPDFHLMVAMNPQSYARDIDEVVSGGWVLYDDTKPLDDELIRDDVTFLGLPLAEMCVEEFEGSRTRILMKNITYVGALVALLGIDMEVVKGMLEEKFSHKQHLMDANFKAIEMGQRAALERFDCPLPIRLETMDATEDCVMVTGNAAAALGCVYAGATVGAWYPITPSTSLMDGFTEYCERFRVDPETGRKRFCIIQAEDELAAAGMVIGAGWMGARAFTPTSGPGISLMSEFIGLAYYAEIPSVFFDVQRTGPSTGMPTRTQQGDLMLAAYASHGDTKHIVLFPADPKECFEFAVAAFDLAERFQTPTFVVSDLDIGMNDWMIPKLEWDDDYRPDRGKVLSADELEEAESFYRYLDVDGDHVPYRTLPGVHPKGAYFTRGSGHDKYGRYTESSDEYVEVVDRILKKVESAGDHVPGPQIFTGEVTVADVEGRAPAPDGGSAGSVGSVGAPTGGSGGDGRVASGGEGSGTPTGSGGGDGQGAAASIGANGVGGSGGGRGQGASAVAAAAGRGYVAPYGLVSVGGCHWAVLEARDELTRRGLDVDYMRIRGFPFNRTVEDFLAGHERVFVIEQNRDEQLRKLLTIETGCPKEKLTSITYYGGQPLSKGHVLGGLAQHIDVLEPREPAAAAT